MTHDTNLRAGGTRKPASTWTPNPLAKMLRIARYPLVAAATLLLGVGDAYGQCTAAVSRLVTDRQLDEAKAQAAASVAKDAKDHAALECLGFVFFRMNRYRDAVEQFEKAVKIDPNVASHHLWLGNALGNLAGDSTSKIKQPFIARRIKGEFEKTVALDPKNVEGRLGLVSFYSQAPGVMGGSMEKAHEQVGEIIKLNPLRGHLKAAQLYTQEKKLAETERELIAAERETPDSTAGGLELGLFYQNNQRWSDAFMVLDRMLKRFPADPVVHFYVGRTAALSGEQLDRGERELKQIIASPPPTFSVQTMGGAHHRLGMIYEKQGRKDLARAEYQVALTIDPRNENAKKSLAALK